MNGFQLRTLSVRVGICLFSFLSAINASPCRSVQCVIDTAVMVVDLRVRRLQTQPATTASDTVANL